MTANRRSHCPRIIIIGPVPPPYHGVTISTENLLHSSLVEEFEVVHLDTSDKRSLDNIGGLDLVNVLVALKNELMLAYLLLKKKPQVLYFPMSQNNLGFFRDGLFVLQAKIFSKAKIILHHHGGEYFTEFVHTTNWFMKLFVRYVMARIDCAIVLGDRLKPVMAEWIRSIESVPNGIIMNPDVSSRSEILSDTLTVSFLGNLFRAKGVVDLLEAATILKKKNIKLKFRFAGEWWGREPDTKIEAMRIIAENNLNEYVEFVGFVNGVNKERFLLQSDIFVFPTWNDSFGLVNIEAMSAACPVISTKDVGVISEIIVDGVTGILVEKQNPVQLAAAIARLAADPVLRKAMGEAGRKRFEQKYTMDIFIERMKIIFETYSRQ